jgi:hypothetical protein
VKWKDPFGLCPKSNGQKKQKTGDESKQRQVSDPSKPPPNPNLDPFNPGHWGPLIKNAQDSIAKPEPGFHPQFPITSNPFTGDYTNTGKKIPGSERISVQVGVTYTFSPK